MNIKQAKEALRVGYQSGMPVVFLSQPGLGKSSIVNQFVEELATKTGEKVGLIDQIRSSTLNPSEAGDIRYIKEDVVKAAVQEWVPSPARVAKGDIPETGIIFLDEIFDSPILSMQSVLQQLFLERRLGSAHVADGWYICAASNRLKDKAAASRPSTALINRAMVLDVEPDADVLYEHFVEIGLSVQTCAYLRFRPDCLSDFNPAARNENMQFLSARSLEAIDNVAKYISPDLDEVVQLELYSGVIGSGRGSEYYGFRKIFDKLPSLNAILKDPTNHPVPDEMDVQVAVAQALIHRTDDLNAENVLKFLVRYPTDIGVASIKDLMPRSKKIAMTQTFKTWAAENSSLIL